MDEQTVAQRIRYFLRDLLGSRVSELLENELARQRESYEDRLRERDETIADLRLQLARATAKLDSWEMIILPLASPVGNLFKPKREPITEPIVEPSSWQKTQREWAEQQAVEAAAERAAKEKHEAVPVEVPQESV